MGRDEVRSGNFGIGIGIGIGISRMLWYAIYVYDEYVCLHEEISTQIKKPIHRKKNPSPSFKIRYQINLSFSNFNPPILTMRRYSILHKRRVCEIWWSFDNVLWCWKLCSFGGLMCGFDVFGSFDVLTFWYSYSFWGLYRRMYIYYI